MKNWLLSLATLAVVGVEQSEVQVKQQKNGLLISPPTLSDGEKYTGCWLNSQKAIPQGKKWFLPGQNSSDVLTFAVCSSSGHCSLVEYPFDMGRSCLWQQGRP